uniref:Uncharacterized protein n=1 Tax=Eutreptiella gymnastica TaxID=73025 RepID=A0A7S4LBF2_9EUGL
MRIRAHALAHSVHRAHRTGGTLNEETSESAPSYDQYQRLKLRKTEVFCMIQGSVECLGCQKSEIHSNAPTIRRFVALQEVRFKTGQHQSFCLPGVECVCLGVGMVGHGWIVHGTAQ